MIGSMTSDTESTPIEIDCHGVRAKLAADEDLLLLDCREPSEFEFVHLAGATFLPMGQIPSRIDELEPYREKEIVVYCHLGIRSLEVATWLRKQGFSKAKSMAGGIEAWAQKIDRSLPRY